MTPDTDNSNPQNTAAAGGISVPQAVNDFVQNTQSKLAENGKEKDSPPTASVPEECYPKAIDVLSNTCKRKALNQFLINKNLTPSPTNFDFNKYEPLKTDAASVVETLYNGILNTIKNRLVISSTVAYKSEDLQMLSKSPWDELISLSESKNIISSAAAAYYRGLFQIIEAIRKATRPLDQTTFDILHSALDSITANYIAFLLNSFDDLEDYLNEQCPTASQTPSPSPTPEQPKSH